ncbi:hypothetical protein [Hymenobacter sp. UYP22]|uniref:hypothetical protein n=1 Tax=Hymenobacter sp. UYP22 TaxID=3156348 RepID=UPI003396C897
MSDTPAYYRQALRRYDKYMHPNWPVATKRALGDYGTLEAGRFQIIGNIFTQGHCRLRRKTDGRLPELSLNGTIVQGADLKPEIEVQHDALSGQALMQLRFSSDRRLALVAADVCTHRIDNLIDVDLAVLQMQRAGLWQKEYVLLTSLVEAKAHILAVATQGQRRGHIKFTVRTPEGMTLIDVLRTQVPLRYAGKRSTESYHYCTAPSTLWFGVHQLQNVSVFLGGNGSGSLQAVRNRGGWFGNTLPANQGSASIYMPPMLTDNRTRTVLQLVPMQTVAE